MYCVCICSRMHIVCTNRDAEKHISAYTPSQVCVRVCTHSNARHTHIHANSITNINRHTAFRILRSARATTHTHTTTLHYTLLLLGAAAAAAATTNHHHTHSPVLVIISQRSNQQQHRTAGWRARAFLVCVCFCLCVCVRLLFYVWYVRK